MTTDRTKGGERQRRAWAGGLMGILAGAGATLGVLVAGGAGVALGAAFGAAAGVWAAALLTAYPGRGAAVRPMVPAPLTPAGWPRRARRVPAWREEGGPRVDRRGPT